jgi:FkbM family methyltransferase
VSRAAPTSGVVRSKVFGSAIDLDLANFIDRMLFLGCYEPTNVRRFRKILAPGMAVIDVGANIGFFSLLAASLVGPSGKVAAIEPHPVNFALLSETIRRNRLDHVQAHCIGLGASPGSGKIYQADQVTFPNRTATMVRNNDTDREHPVTVRALDDCIDEWGFDTVDLLKVDVDGFELEVLAGAQKSIRAGRIKHLLIELTEYWLNQANSSPDAAGKMIAEWGMRDVSAEDWVASTLLGPVPDRLFSFRAPST